MQTYQTQKQFGLDDFMENFHILDKKLMTNNLPEFADNIIAGKLFAKRSILYMKATGIVRRIDDLGRVVIPKEIRRTMRIREGDPLEIYTDREGEVIFKKYSPIGELTGFASQYAETMHKTCDISVMISDRDCVIACAGVPKKDYMDKRLSTDVEKIIEARNLYTYNGESKKIFMTEEGMENYYISCAMPIISEGDIIGCVAAVIGIDSEKLPEDIEVKLIQTAANFLGKHIEA